MSTVVNVYAADCADFDNEGICPLMPSAWTHTEAANGKSVLALSHPYDAEGRHYELKRERILKADVPVRNVPEIQGGAYVATVEKWRVRATATKAQRYLYSRETKGRKMKCLPKGLEVYACKQGESRMKIRTTKYGTGWIATDGIESMVERVPYDSDRAVEAATPSEEVRSQLFRIVEVKRKLDGVEVTAEHIFYDLAGNLTDWNTQQSFTAQEMLDGIRSGCVDDCEFTFQTDIGDSRLSAEIRARNPVDALLNAEDGFIGRFGGEIIRDNYDITILRQAGMDRGLRVEFGRNLTGIEASWSADGVVTAIRPVGENKDGSALYLDGERVIDAPGAGDYAYRRIAEMQVSEAKVDKNVSVDLARARMREAVQAEFDRGVHLPGVNIKVEFARLGDSEEYAAYRALEHCFLYDTVHASCEHVCGDLELNVVSRTWDGMKRRFTKVELGVLGEDMSTGKLSATQIPSGISGLKIMPGTIGSGAIQAEAIATRHFQAQSVNTQALQAESVTAEKIAAESITTNKLAASSVTAEKLEAGTVDAHIVTAVEGKFKTIDAGNIETDALGAEVARITRLIAKTADVDWAHIKDIATDTAIITKGEAGKLFISQLAVTEANMVSLTTGELVVKGADGCFYAISVDGEGNVAATLKQISNADVKDLSLNAGEKLIEGSVTAACLNAREIFADSALVRELIAANLSVDTLFAREAFTDRLATSEIVGGKSLTVIAGEASGALQALENMQIGGRNLLLKSATKRFGVYGDTTLAFTDGVAVSEWGAKDAIRCTGTGGSTAIIANMNGVSIAFRSVAGQEYVHSIYLRNDGEKAIYLNNNGLGATARVESGESRRVILKGTGTGIHNLQFNLSTAAVGDAFDFTYWHPKIELGNVATDWTAAPEDADSEFAQFVTKVGGEIDDLQSQIDGNITTWFYSAAPTAANAPAKDWTTAEVKNRHLGDLYYDGNGYCYRWQLNGGAYGWTRITDTDVTKALSDAKAAQDTADGKRRVFVTTPKPPYDVGDMWAQGSGGELLRCATAKAAGASYAESDWVKASKYTDDALASEALAKIDGQQIGGRNLLLSSSIRRFSAYQGAALTFAAGVSVPEWGAEDAIRCAGTGGSDSTIFATMGGVSAPGASVEGQDYTHSIYIRNDGAKALRITNNNLSGAQRVESGESRRVILKGTGDGVRYLQFNLMTETAGDAFDFVYWRPKIEQGNRATAWSAAPEDGEIHVSATPPPAPILPGKQWLDQSVTPWTLRSWIGADVTTGAAFSTRAAGNPLVLDAGRVASLDAVRVSFGPVRSGSGAPYPPGGGRNKLKINAASATKNGVTFTVNANGSVTVSGTTTAGNTFFNLNYIDAGTSQLKPGTYILSGGSANVNLRGYLNGSYPVADSGNGATLTIPANAKSSWLRLDIADAGTTVNETIWPMARLSTETDGSFAPYANLRPLSPRTGLKLTRSGKNLLKINAASATKNGVTFTVNANGSVTVSGTTTAGNTFFNLNYIDAGTSQLKPGTYILSGGSANVNLRGYLNGSYPVADSGNGATLTIPADVKSSWLRLDIAYAGTTVNETIWPMARPADVADGSFEAYAADEYAAEFDREVYGGDLYWQPSGKCASRYGIATLDGSDDEGWTIYTGSTGAQSFYTSGYSALAGIAATGDRQIPGWCSWADTQDGMIAGMRRSADDSDRIYIPAETLTGWGVAAGDLDGFKAMLAENPMQIAYKLAATTWFTPAPSEIAPQEGVNVLVSEGDAITAEATASGWRVVNDPEALQGAQDELAARQALSEAELARLGMALVVDGEGVHVHRPVDNPGCETLTSDDSFNVVVNNAIASTFAASYTKLGEQIVVRQTSNGLIFGG